MGQGDVEPILMRAVPRRLAQAQTLLAGPVARVSRIGRGQARCSRPAAPENLLAPRAPGLGLLLGIGAVEGIVVVEKKYGSGTRIVSGRVEEKAMRG